MSASRIVYLNGEFLPFEQAKVPIMDRGFLFADGIYEVSAILDGRLVDNAAHLARLDRSLGEIGIRNPHDSAAWEKLQTELVQRNGVTEGLVYMQVTRGVAERDFAYPSADTPPTVMMFTQAKTVAANPLAEKGARVITVEDLRWKRRDIKSVALLAQVLAKQQAVEAGVSEAWMVEDGAITEGSSSTAFIVSRDRKLVTRPLSTALLPGITRASVLKLAAEADLTIEERLIPVAEALEAAEAFYTSASAFVMPVVEIDGRAIGEGKPGPLTKRLRELYLDWPAPAEAFRAGNRNGLGCHLFRRDFVLDHGGRVAEPVSSLQSACRRPRGAADRRGGAGPEPGRSPAQAGQRSRPPPGDPDAAGPGSPERRRPAERSIPLGQASEERRGHQAAGDATGTVVKPDQSGSMPVIKPGDLPGRTPGTEAK